MPASINVATFKAFIAGNKKWLFWGWVILLSTVLRLVFFFQHVHAPLALDAEYPIDVSTGTTFNRLVNRLAESGVITHPFDARLYGRLSGRANAIKAGEYALTPGMALPDLLDKLIAGDVIVHQVVLVEGWTLAQALAAIQSHPMVQDTLVEPAPGELQSLLGTARYPEGRIFPDTYHFSRGTSDSELLQRAYKLMEEVLEREWLGRAMDLPYATPDEALVMASIIEKETALASERDLIAGVFVRRLQRRMRLQTDPTVIYGLGPDFSGNLTRADLRSPSPYNTYLNAGLPPTPIALPGRESIHAALHPAEGDTLYFVARGDGSHQFSSTLEEHERAVVQYQLGRTQ